jgi:hypothetical protein
MPLQPIFVINRFKAETGGTRVAATPLHTMETAPVLKINVVTSAASCRRRLMPVSSLRLLLADVTDRTKRMSFNHALSMSNDAVDDVS